jgi:hypothetical protein
MTVERAPGGASLIDVLDRVLDKGIVVEEFAWVRISLVEIDLNTVEERGIGYRFRRLPGWVQLMIVITLLLLIGGVVKLFSSM